MLQGLGSTGTETTMSPSKREYQRVIQENLGADLSSTRYKNTEIMMIFMECILGFLLTSPSHPQPQKVTVIT